MPYLIFLLLMLSHLAGAEGHLDVLVSGAGPGGLAAGIAARLAGARDVLVIERRPQTAWATRERSVFVSDETVRTLTAFGVDVPMTPIAAWHVVRGARQRRLPNAGHWKDEIFARIFHRRFEGIVSIDAFERRLLDHFLALGGRVLYDTAAEVTDPGGANAPARVRFAGRELTTDLLVVAEGARSETRARLGIATVEPALGTNPTYASIDFRVPASGHPGQCFFFISPDGGLDGYGCRADGYGTFGLINPQRFADAERAAKLADMARQIGVEPKNPARGYEGRLSLARGVRRGRAVLIGDSARRTDPSSSSGLNGAIVDAVGVGEFVRDRHLVPFGDRARRLGRAVADDTADVLRKALYFQDLFAWGATSLRRVWGVAPLGTVTSPAAAPGWSVHDAFYRFGLLLPAGAQGWAVDRAMRAARGPTDITADRYPDLPVQLDEDCAVSLTEGRPS